MRPNKPSLQLSGYSSASRLEDIFASQMVDVARLLEVTEEYALVVPYEPEHTDLNNRSDRAWLTKVVEETLKIAGENSVNISFLPTAP